MSSRDLSARDSAVGSGDDGRVSPWLDEVRSWISRQTEPATAHGTRPVERGNSTGIEKENTPEVKVGHKDMPKDSRGIETVSVADNFSPAYRSALVRSRDVDTVSVADNFNRKAGVGINISNALEAPNEGDWGVVLQSKYFQAIKEAEFSNVRLPVNWAAHSLKDYPYTVDPKFFARIDWAIKEARANGLEIILNMQNYDDLVNDPDGNDGKNSKRFVDIWKQIAEHYSDQPKDLAFELYNEPAINIDAKKWNLLLLEALKAVRPSNPDRCVVVGPVDWNDVKELPHLELPADDKNILVTFHYYEPRSFTHQGAPWVKDSDKMPKTEWTGSPAERAEIKKAFDFAENWGKQHHRPIYLGEFGAISKADMDSRARWTSAVQTEAKSHGMSSSYWDFCAWFGAYDSQSNKWYEPLLNALTGKRENHPELSRTQPRRPEIWRPHPRSMEHYDSASLMSRPSRSIEKSVAVRNPDLSAVTPGSNWDTGWSADTIALKDKLVQDIGALSQPEKETFTNNIQAFFNRARLKGLDEKIEVDSVLKSCDRLLKPGADEVFLDRLSGKEKGQQLRTMLSEQIINEAAYPSHTQQGYFGCCPAAAVETRTWFVKPSVAASIIADQALTGKWIAADGNVVKLPEADFATDKYSQLSSPPDGMRSYADQLFQATELSDVGTRRAAPIYYVTSGIATDENGREGGVEYWVDANGKFVKPFAGLNDVPNAQELARLDGPNTEILTSKPSWAGAGANVVVFNGKEDLKQKLKEAQESGKMPVIINVAINDKFFGEVDPSGDHALNHDVCIDKYDPETGTLVIDNSWGAKSDWGTKSVLGSPEDMNPVANIDDFFPATQ